MAAERLHGDDSIDRAGAGKRQDRHRTVLDLPPRRPAVRRLRWVARRDLPLLARPARRASAGASCWIRRDPARRTPTTATTSCISQTGSPARSARRRAGCMLGAPSSPWPTSRRNARRKASGKKETSLSPIAIEVVRRIDALLLPSSARSTARARKSASRSGRVLSRPLVDDLMTYMREQAARLSRGHGPRQGDPVYAQALAGIHAVPRRRARLHVQQRPPSVGWQRASRSGENRGCSADLTAEAGALQACTGLSSPPR